MKTTDTDLQVALLRARIDGALFLHASGAGQGYLPDGTYGWIEPACTTCGTEDEYAVPWPCPTVRALRDTL